MQRSVGLTSLSEMMKHFQCQFKTNRISWTVSWMMFGFEFEQNQMQRLWMEMVCYWCEYLYRISVSETDFTVGKNIIATSAIYILSIGIYSKAHPLHPISVSSELYRCATHKTKRYWENKIKQWNNWPHIELYNYKLSWKLQPNEERKLCAQQPKLVLWG